jgi:serine/threonine-protein kinase
MNVRVVELFEAAVVLDPSERRSFVRNACADDPDVCRQVEAMLDDAERSVIIDRPVGETVGELFNNPHMVAAGTRFGPYQVESLLGAGGMGEVYRATDTVLGRQVAIKILPADVSRDPERTARFRREARILASLNHSNIGAIYGVEASGDKSDSPLGLVLELIEGPTLADRLRSGPLPVDEALAAARQIAEALDAAHQLGVVHRDLKPGNIKVRDDGVVKVLDFGLARVEQTQTDPSSHPLVESPTITTPAMTAAGVLLGTAAYMSPEQAKGRPADKRSDIWAFGCVLYEMLAGTRVFGGDDVADTLAAVLRGEPDYALLPRETPDAVRVLLRGSLTKDRIRRLGDMSAVRFVLDNVVALGSSGMAHGGSPPPGRPSIWRRAAFPAAAALALAVAAGSAVWFFTRPPAATVTAYEIKPTGAAALFVDGVSRDVAVLPDGAIVYKGFGTKASTAALFLRTRDRVEPTLLMTGGSPRAPFSSPDGRRIGYVDIGSGSPQLKTMPLSGGPPILLADLDGPSSGITWGDDDSIVFATNVPETGLQRVRHGSNTTVLTRPDAAKGEGDHQWPHYLPGSRAVLYTIIPALGATDPSDIAVLNLETNERTRLNLRGASHAYYVSSGHLVYVVGATLFAVRFDVESLTVKGTPTALPYEVVVISSGAAEFDIGRDGTLAYVPAGTTSTSPRSLVWVDRAGRETSIGAPAREYVQPRLSRDSSQLAVYVADGDSDVYVWNFALRKLTPITLEAGPQIAPIWLDDRHIAYASRASGAPSSTGSLMRRAVDGTGDAEPLVRQEPAPAMLPSSVYGGILFASTLFTTSDILQITLGDGRMKQWFQTAFFERNAEASPDGRWVAYEASNPAQTLEYNVYIRPREDFKAAQWRVSNAGGRQPAWSPDGKELFYVGPDGTLLSVQIDSGATPNPRSPQPIVRADYYHGLIGGMFSARMYDVSPDAQRFLMMKEAAADRSAQTAGIMVRHDWIQELNQLVPSR